MYTFIVSSNVQSFSIVHRLAGSAVIVVGIMPPYLSITSYSFLMPHVELMGAEAPVGFDH